MVDSQVIINIDNINETNEIDDVISSMHTLNTASKAALMQSTVLHDAGSVTSRSSASLSTHGGLLGTAYGSEITDAKFISDRAQSPVISEIDWDADDDEVQPNKYDPVFIYTQICKALGIVPVSAFIRNLDSTILPLNHHGLGQKGIKAIGLSLASNANINVLQLSDNGLGPDGGLSIIDTLKENGYINDVDISMNRLMDPTIKSLCNMMLDNSTVSRLNLSNNLLGDKSCSSFYDMMKANFSLTYLNISHNKFEEDGAILLGAGIAENEVLKHLDISWNSISGKGAVAIAQGLKNNSTLRTLDLSYNGFGNDGGIAIGEALRSNSTLTNLNLSNNHIHLNGANGIAKGLESNDSLQNLNLNSNPFETTGAVAILSSIKKASNSSINLIGFENICVTVEMKDLITELKEKLNDFKITHGEYSWEAAPRNISKLPILKLKEFLTEKGVQLLDLFKKFDHENAGTVETKEFHKALRNMSLPMTPREISELIKSMDETLCSVIEYDEYINSIGDLLN